MIASCAMSKSRFTPSARLLRSDWSAGLRPGALEEADCFAADRTSALRFTELSCPDLFSTGLNVTPKPERCSSRWGARRLDRCRRRPADGPAAIGLAPVNE